MSILAKGIKMPECCDYCLLNHDNMSCSATGTRWWSDSFVLLDFDEHKDRLPDCPLVELKPHGDLIDMDALKKDYKMGKDCDTCEPDWKSCQYDIVYSKMDFCGWLDDTPVVIEAEGEE